MSYWTQSLYFSTATEMLIFVYSCISIILHTQLNHYSVKSLLETEISSEIFRLITHFLLAKYFGNVML